MLTIDFARKVATDILLPHCQAMADSKEETNEQRNLAIASFQRLALLEVDTGTKIKNVAGLLPSNTKRAVTNVFKTMYSKARKSVEYLVQTGKSEVLDAWRNGEVYTVEQERANGEVADVPVTMSNAQSIFLSKDEKRALKLEAIARAYHKLNAVEQVYVRQWSESTAKNGPEVGMDWAKDWFAQAIEGEAVEA